MTSPSLYAPLLKGPTPQTLSHWSPNFQFPKFGVIHHSHVVTSDPNGWAFHLVLKQLLFYTFYSSSLSLPKDAPCLPLSLSNENIIITTSNCMGIKGNHLCGALHMMLCTRLSLHDSDYCVPCENELWREKGCLSVCWSLATLERYGRPDQAGLGEPEMFLNSNWKETGGPKGVFFPHRKEGSGTYSCPKAQVLLRCSMACSSFNSSFQAHQPVSWEFWQVFLISLTLL